MGNVMQLFVLQLQVPIQAGDLVEARAKARNLLSNTQIEENMSFFQIVPAMPESKGK